MIKKATPEDEKKIILTLFCTAFIDEIEKMPETKELALDFFDRLVKKYAPEVG